MSSTTDTAFPWILESAFAAADDLLRPARENRGDREIAPTRLSDAQKDMRGLTFISVDDGNAAMEQLRDKITEARTKRPDSLDHKVIVTPLENLVKIIDAKVKAAAAGDTAPASRPSEGQRAR